MSGQLPEAVTTLQPIGRLDGASNLNLAISLPLRDREALAAFIEQLYEPASPSYRHYLTPDEFTARFGPTEDDYQAVMNWATRNGFTISASHSSRMLLEVTASVSTIERAFQVTMRTYEHPTEHRVFYAPDAEPSVDAGLQILGH